MLERRDQRQQRLQFDRMNIQQNDSNRKARQILLMREILVDRHEDIERRTSEGEELPILRARPAHLSDSANLVRGKRTAKPPGYRLVKQQAHRP